MNAHVISLGGSLVHPEAGIDVDFVRNFAEYVGNYARTHHCSFAVVCGGGTLARKYQLAARAITPGVENKKLDQIGIAAT